MRQVFSSARVENAEAVAQLLREAGIDVRVTDGVGWRGSIRGNFSYRESAAQQRPKATVWVLRADQITEARNLLHEEGLLDSPRSPLGSYVPQSVHDDTLKPARARWGKWLLLGGIALFAGLAVRGMRSTLSDAPPSRVATVASTPAAGGVESVVPTVHRIPVPPALAEMLGKRANAACVLIDGQPTAQASGCDGVRIDVRNYRTDGSGTGTVELATQRRGAIERVETLNVERVDVDWFVR